MVINELDPHAEWSVGGSLYGHNTLFKNHGTVGAVSGVGLTKGWAMKSHVSQTQNVNGGTWKRECNSVCLFMGPWEGRWATGWPAKEKQSLWHSLWPLRHGQPSIKATLDPLPPICFSLCPLPPLSPPAQFSHSYKINCCSSDFSAT